MIQEACQNATKPTDIVSDRHQGFRDEEINKIKRYYFEKFKFPIKKMCSMIEEIKKPPSGFPAVAEIGERPSQKPILSINILGSFKTSVTHDPD